MANHSCGNRRQQGRTVPVRQAAFPEPAVRRWPHPINGTEPEQIGDPALHYIRCALSYQNQLLSEIKALLEALPAAKAEEK